MTTMQVARPPRRFRTRLLLVLVGAGALSIVATGVVGAIVIDQFLAISLEPVAAVLYDVDRYFETQPQLQPTTEDGAPLVEAVQQAEIFLIQADLARRSLTHIAPLAFAAVLAVVSIVLAVIAVRMSRRLSIPIEELTTGMLHYASGDLDHRVPETPARDGDELEFLLRRFNEMGAQLQFQRERLQITEELAAWQGVARALAHELKNPLTAMKMAVARTARAVDKLDLAPARQTPFRESIELLDQEMDVLIRMTKSFSAFARLPQPDLQPLDLATLLDDVAGLYGETSPVPIDVDIAGAPMTVSGDADQLRRAVGNLVKNAIEASTAEDGPIRISVEPRDDHVQIVVADAGRGIEKPLHGKDLTRSLGSTKPDGSGLGLPIAYKIIHGHRGRLWLEPGGDRGCRAMGRLPRSSPQSPKISASEESSC